MMNVVINNDGCVEKRKGCKVLVNRSSATLGYYGFTSSAPSLIIPIRTSTNINLLLVRNGTSLVVLVYEPATGYWYPDAAPLVDIFPASSSSSTTPWDFTVLQEQAYTRIMLAHPNYVPINIAITSGSGVATYTDLGATITAVIATPPYINQNFLNGGSAPVIWLHDNITVDKPISIAKATYDWSNATFTFTDIGLTLPNGAHNVTWVAVTANFCTESILLKGNQLVDTVVQSVSSPHIPVPANLLKDIRPLGTSVGQYPMHVYSSTAFDAKLTYTNPPTTSAMWSHSAGDGGALVGTSQSPSTPFWITIGANVATARTLLISRMYWIPFSGGNGASPYATNTPTAPNEAINLTTGTLFTRNNAAGLPTAPPSEGGASTGVTAGGGYALRSFVGAFTTATTSFTYPAVRTGGRFLTFDQTANATGGAFGSAINANDWYSFSDTDGYYLYTAGFIGSAFNPASFSGNVSTVQGGFFGLGGTNYLRYNAYPIVMPLALYGIFDYANYYTGSFPATVKTFQRRLVFGGFRDDPMLLAISNIDDLGSAQGAFCCNFQTYLQSDYGDSSGLSLTLPSSADDKIVAMIEHNNSLFVFTKYKIFRVFGADGVLTPTNVQYSVVAGISCLNCRSVKVMEGNIVFLATTGVYVITPDNTESGYNVQDISGSIKAPYTRHINAPSSNAFIVYDTGRKRLYVSMKETHGSLTYQVMYVYFPVFNCWTRFSVDGMGFPVTAGCSLSYTDTATELPDIIFQAQFTSTANNHRFISMDSRYDYDLIGCVKYPSASITWAIEPGKCVWTCSTSKNYWFDRPTSAPVSIGYMPVPITNHNDFNLWYETGVGAGTFTKLVFGTDYIKTRRGIRLTSAPQSGRKLYAQMKMDADSTATYNVLPTVLVQNGVTYLPNRNFVATASAANETYTAKWDFTGTLTPDTTNPCYYGAVFTSWVTTPAVTGDTLGTKNVKHIILYFDNENILQYTDQRVNLHIGIMFNDTNTGYEQTDLYGLEQSDSGTGLWFQSDLYGEQQDKPYSRVMIPIVGNGEVINAILFTDKPTVFKLVGYEWDYDQTIRQGFSYSERGALR
jgi:hypothetical protein